MKIHKNFLWIDETKEKIQANSGYKGITTLKTKLHNMCGSTTTN